MIPKIIHQTLPSKNSIDIRLIENIKNIKNTNNDWEHRLYDDLDIRNYIVKNYGSYYLSLFDKIRPEYGAAKADFFRYLVVYNEGGVYLDIKSTVTASLTDSLRIDDEYILSYWSNGVGEEFEGVGFWPQYGVPNELQQWHIMSIPKHPFLKKIIEQVIKNIINYNWLTFGVGTLGTILTTGPLVYTKIINSMIKDNNLVFRVVTNKELNIKYSIFDTKLAEHRLIVGSDYSTQVAPLVKMSIVSSLVCTAIFTTKLKLKKFERIYIRKVVKKILCLFSGVV